MNRPPKDVQWQPLPDKDTYQVTVFGSNGFKQENTITIEPGQTITFMVGDGADTPVIASPHGSQE